MRVRDQRSVAELLLEAEQVARDLLYEAPDRDGRAMVRTWGEVMDTAADLWAQLPTGPPVPGQHRSPEQPGVIDQLQASARSLHRRDRKVHDDGGYDDQLLVIADSYARAGELVAKYHNHDGSQTPERQDDVHAARTRIMHTLYVTAHVVTVALTNDLRAYHDQHRDSTVTAKGYPLYMLADAHRRMSAAEQLAGSYLPDTYPEALSGQHRDRVDPERLADAVARWDVQAHRALAGTPDAHTLAFVTAQETWLVSASSILWRAAAQTGHVNESQYRTRLCPALERLWEEWGQAARTWTELTPKNSPAPPAHLRAAGNELRAATRELIHDRVGGATPEVIAARVDLGKVASTLQRSLASTVDLAHAVRDAGNEPGLLVSAKGANRFLAQRAEQGFTPDDIHAVVPPREIHGNRSIPVPESLRPRVGAIGQAAVDAAHLALGSSTGIAPQPLRKLPDRSKSRDVHHGAAVPGESIEARQARRDVSVPR